MVKTVRASLAVVVVGGALLALPATAHAAPELAPVMLVLDASGSMKENMPGGGTKMAAAKAAVHTLVQQAPDDARIGLSVYGTGTGNSAVDKAAGCKDVTVVRKVDQLDRPALTATVGGVQPRGFTPIGQSLRVAAAELPSSGPRSVVLVSDGVDTCAPPDPCEVARELAKAGVGLRVHAIGFAVDGAARQQLSCLAQATGGTYVDAADGATLASALNRVTQQALRSYQAVGTPVQGTRSPDGAPKLGTGNYLDRIGSGEKRYYAVDVPPGHTLFASATVVVPDGNEFFVQVYRYDTQECVGGGTSTATQAKLPVISTGMRWQAPSPGTSASPSPRACYRPGPQLVQVTLDPVFNGRPYGEGALEVLIGLEPPLTGAAGPEGTKDHVRFEAPTGPTAAVVGGGSFTTAATLDGPGKYTDTVFEGEMVFYRIRLDWGQGLAFRMRLGEFEYTGSGGGFIVSGYFFDPVRSEVDLKFGSSNGAAVTIPKEGSKPDAVGGPPVRYRNREIGGFESGVSIAGWYYIAVMAQNDLSKEKTPVPVTIEVSVNGNAQPAPGYVGGAGKDSFGEQAQGTRSSAGSTGQEKGFWSTVATAGLLLWGGLVLLMLVAGAALAGLLLIRRRRRPAGP
jgi:Ca-activated chloride channel family protein